MKELDEFDCNTDSTDTYDDSFDQLCVQNLEKAALKPLGDFNKSHDDFWDYIKNTVYLPLGFEVSKKGSVSEILNDLIFLDDKSSSIGAHQLNGNFHKFENIILKNFEGVEK